MEKYISDFIKQVYPDGTELAIFSNDEKTCIVDATNLIKALRAKVQSQEAKCPKCESTNFDVFDEDCDIEQYFIKYDCACLDCGHEFTIEGKMVITKITNR